MGVTRLSNQSIVQPNLPPNSAQCLQPFCRAAKHPTVGQHSPHEVDDATDFSHMPEIRKLFSGNEICLENGLFILIFGFSAIVLLVCCLTARRRRLSTLTIGSVLILTYFSIGFGFVDPHWIEGRPNAAILTSYCFFSKGDLVQVSVQASLPGFNKIP